MMLGLDSGDDEAHSLLLDAYFKYKFDAAGVPLSKVSFYHGWSGYVLFEPLNAPSESQLPAMETLAGSNYEISNILLKFFKDSVDEQYRNDYYNYRKDVRGELHINWNQQAFTHIKKVLVYNPFICYYTASGVPHGRCGSRRTSCSNLLLVPHCDEHYLIQVPCCVELTLIPLQKCPCAGSYIRSIDMKRVCLDSECMKLYLWPKLTRCIHCGVSAIMNAKLCDFCVSDCKCGKRVHECICHIIYCEVHECRHRDGRVCTDDVVCICGKILTDYENQMGMRLCEQHYDHWCNCIFCGEFISDKPPGMSGIWSRVILHRNAPVIVDNIMFTLLKYGVSDVIYTINGDVFGINTKVLSHNGCNYTESHSNYGDMIKNGFRGLVPLLKKETIDEALHYDVTESYLSTQGIPDFAEIDNAYIRYDKYPDWIIKNHHSGITTGYQSSRYKLHISCLLKRYPLHAVIAHDHGAE